MKENTEYDWVERAGQGEPTAIAELFLMALLGILRWLRMRRPKLFMPRLRACRI